VVVQGWAGATLSSPAWDLATLLQGLEGEEKELGEELVGEYWAALAGSLLQAGLRIQVR
jgi:hypothetical protein